MVRERVHDTMCPTSMQLSERTCTGNQEYEMHVGNNGAIKLNADNISSKKSNGFIVIFFGQTIALSLAFGNAASSTLENRFHVQVPTFQTGFVYLILSFHLIYLFLRHCRLRRNYGEFSSETWDKGALMNHKRGEGKVLSNSLYDKFGQQHTSSPLEVSYQKQIIESPRSSSIDSRPEYFLPFADLPLQSPWYNYLLLAMLDVEANYLAMISFQHTSLSSSMLLTSLSILSTLALRYFVFRVWKPELYQRTICSKRKLLGATICILGGCLWLWTDFYRGKSIESSGNYALTHDVVNDTDETQQSKHQIIVYGDLLALCAAFLYGLNDVLAEYTVKSNNDRIEYLGMLGLFGSLISFIIQVPLLERDRVSILLSIIMESFFEDSNSTEGPAIIIQLVWFLFTMCYFYIAITVFLSKNDATILNLSLQTCPL
mmetsp:Transcript_1724/g.3785  ORF Transcript_1724/g.3785 Transcript_1724/m.3785 type:complete len:430 (-) Transcript_1724:171-1460(-)